MLLQFDLTVQIDQDFQLELSIIEYDPLFVQISSIFYTHGI